MVRPNYRDFRLNSVLPVVQDSHIHHSAKGSTWEDHKYIKRVDGTYYYPDSYEGGRHLPDGEKSSDDKKTDKDVEDWERTLYDEIEEHLKRNPGLFDPSEITDDNFQDFGLTLAEFAGVDSDKISKEELERMRKKVKDHYDDMKAARTLESNDVENLAKEVIRGNFGNGQQRKDLLGENYAEVQKRVNELMKGSAGSKKTSEASAESVKKVEEIAKKVDSSSSANSNVHSGVDMNKVQEVYRKKK